VYVAQFWRQSVCGPDVLDVILLTYFQRHLWQHIGHCQLASRGALHTLYLSKMCFLQALATKGSTMVGTGLTPEAIEQVLRVTPPRSDHLRRILSCMN
jgi:hypothetical protein